MSDYNDNSGVSGDDGGDDNDWGDYNGGGDWGDDGGDDWGDDNDHYCPDPDPNPYQPTNDGYSEPELTQLIPSLEAFPGLFNQEDSSAGLFTDSLTTVGDLYGTDGNDLLVGSKHTFSQSVFGGSGNDLLVGGAENSYLYGGAGDDTLIGYQNSAHYGGTGTNHLVGDGGSDTFILQNGANYIYRLELDDLIVVQSLDGLYQIGTDGGTDSLITYTDLAGTSRQTTVYGALVDQLSGLITVQQ